MQESLIALFKLQEVDLRLHELEQLKTDIPHQVAELDRRKAALEQRLTEMEETLETLRKTHRQHERDLVAIQEQIKKYQGQLLTVKTNREYDALQTEISGQKSRISTHEEAILRLLEEIDAGDKALNEVKNRSEEESQSIEGARVALMERYNTVDEHVQRTQEERSGIAADIENRVVQAYDRIRRVRKDSAVVGLKKRACGGCFHIIPLQVITEIRRMNRLITCEGCGRILVIEPGTEDEPLV